jgi:hypothetical protein
MLHHFPKVYAILLQAASVYQIRISSGWFSSGGDIKPTDWRSFWRRCFDHSGNWTKSSWKWITGLVESVMLKTSDAVVYHWTYEFSHFCEITGELLLVGSDSAELSIKAFFWGHWIHLWGNTLLFFFLAQCTIVYYSLGFKILVTS